MENDKSQTKREVPEWIGLYFVVLVGLLFYGVYITHTLPLVESNIPTSPQATYTYFSPGWTQSEPVQAVLEPWLRWDTIRYLQIAKDGYQPGGNNLAYPVVYPLLIRIFARLLGGQYLLASLLISWAAFFGVCALLVRWGKEQHDPLNTSSALRRMLFFPAAFFFFAGYTESLFLLFILLAWQQADRKKWLWAGLIGAAAALTKFVGVFLVLPFGWMWLKDFLQTKKWTGIFGLSPIPLAYLGWTQYTQTVYGLSPSAALHQGWTLHFAWPWVGLIGSLQKLVSEPFSETIYIYFDLFSVAIVAVSAIWWLKRKRFEIALFLASVLLISLMKIADIGILGSTARYMLPLFPVYFTQISLFEKKPYKIIILMFFIALWLLGAAMFFSWNWIA